MIPKEIGNRIARYYLHNFLPNRIIKEQDDLLIPYYLGQEEPSADEMVWFTIKFLQNSLEH